MLHSGKGEVLCRCPPTGVERSIAFQGFEAERGTLKYRCPAARTGREACPRDAGYAPETEARLASGNRIGAGWPVEGAGLTV